LTKRDLLALEDWPPEAVEELLNLAQRVKRGELANGLNKRILGMVFLHPAASIRVSLETAMFLHGGQAVALESAEENLEDAARLLGRTMHGVGVRTFPVGADWAMARQDPVLRSFARNCSKPVINLGSTRRDPCQGLADMLTLRERLGRVEGKRLVLTWAWSPHPLSTAVPASAALAAARLGMEIVIARPEGYELDPEDTALIRKTAQQAGGEFVHISDDPDDALVGADAVYVASWGSVKLFGNPEQEHQTRAAHQDWRLTSPRMRSTRGGKGIVLHAYPVRRNGEIEDKVLESGNAAVLEQAENRLHAHRAVLLELLGDTGSR
jgi:N-acetylornithine carbamoyltransferase